MLGLTPKTVKNIGIAATAMVLFSACSLLPGQTSEPVQSTTNTGGAPAAAEKSGDTTKTGVISEAGGSYFLQEAGDTPRVVESYSVDLSQYVGQTVTVTGQYSGDTLFIGSLE